MRTPPPSWFWIALGVLVVAALEDPPPRSPASPTSTGSPGPDGLDVSARVPHPPRPPRAVGPPCARDLRRIPGIGALRAVALVDARWEAERAGRTFEPRDVPGIGPALEAQLAAHAGAARDGLAGGGAQ